MTPQRRRLTKMKQKKPPKPKTSKPPCPKKSPELSPPRDPAHPPATSACTPTRSRGGVTSPRVSPAPGHTSPPVLRATRPRAPWRHGEIRLIWDILGPVPPFDRVDCCCDLGSSGGCVPLKRWSETVVRRKTKLLILGLNLVVSGTLGDNLGVTWGRTT